MRPDELALAVSGLAGIVGFLLLPMIGGWLRMFFQFIESGRGLGNTPRLSGRAVIVASSLTTACGLGGADGGGASLASGLWKSSLSNTSSHSCSGK